MTILVYKDGRWLIDNEQPLEGVSLDNLAAILSNPKDGDVVKYDEESGMWIAGEAGGGLPAVTSADNGKVLSVKDGAWAAQQKKFIVTLTPTSLDFSGTMDKTVAEINAAYEAGMEIVFRIYASATSYYDIVATVSFFAETDDAKRFMGFGILEDNLIEIKTPVGVENAYYAAFIYSLTPAS